MVVCGTTLKESERNKKPEGVASIGVRGEGEVSHVGPTAGPGLGWWCMAGTHPGFGSHSRQGSLQGPPLPEPLPTLQLATLGLLGGGARPWRITLQSAGKDPRMMARRGSGLRASTQSSFLSEIQRRGLGKGEPQRSARAAGPEGLTGVGGTGDCGGRAASRREPEFLEGRAGARREGVGVCRGAAPRGDLGGGAARRGGRARSSTGVCGGRENPFVADRSRSGLRRGRGRPSPVRPHRRRRGPSSPPLPADPPGWLSALTQAPWEEAGKVLVARKVRAARVSHPPRSLSPPAPQLSLLLMQNLGRGWGRPRRQWPWLGVCQETAPGQAGSLLPNPHPLQHPWRAGGPSQSPTSSTALEACGPVPTGAGGGGKSWGPLCLAAACPGESSPGGPAPDRAHPGERFPLIFYPHTAPLPPS